MTPAGLYIGACKGLVVCKGLVLDCSTQLIFCGPFPVSQTKGNYHCLTQSLSSEEKCFRFLISQIRATSFALDASEVASLVNTTVEVGFLAFKMRCDAAIENRVNSQLYEGVFPPRISLTL